MEVGGECHKPRTFDLDDLFGFEQEERVYRFRCVETWAMDIPWTGFPLSKLLEAVQPTGKARHVRFITAHRPDQMPGLGQKHYPWPYYEALRLDEAMHDLTLAVTGVYGKPLLKQHGAPVRIIVPWKYGYKSPKSIVKIELVAKKPGTFWSGQALRARIRLPEQREPQRSPSPVVPGMGLHAGGQRGPAPGTSATHPDVQRLHRPGGPPLPGRTHQAPARPEPRSDCPLTERLPTPRPSNAESTSSGEGVTARSGPDGILWRRRSPPPSRPGGRGRRPGAP